MADTESSVRGTSATINVAKEQSFVNPSLSRLKERESCQVCFEDGDSEDLAHCRTCKIYVHRSCYMGEKDDFNASTGWKCDPCKCCVNVCETVCRVCPMTGGALKKVYGQGPNDWVHLPCVRPSLLNLFVMNL
jgi:hypothetical protein